MTQADQTTAEPGELTDTELSGVAGGSGPAPTTGKQVNHIQDMLGELMQQEFKASGTGGGSTGTIKKLGQLLQTFEQDHLAALNGKAPNANAPGGAKVSAAEREMIDKIENLLEKMPGAGKKTGIGGGSAGLDPAGLLKMGMTKGGGSMTHVPTAVTGEFMKQLTMLTEEFAKLEKLEGKK